MDFGIKSSLMVWWVGSSQTILKWWRVAANPLRQLPLAAVPIVSLSTATAQALERCYNRKIMSAFGKTLVPPAPKLGVLAGETWQNTLAPVPTDAGIRYATMASWDGCWQNF